MRTRSGKTRWTLFLFLLAGMVLGSFIGYYLAPYPALAWLDYGQQFGLSTPVTLTLGILSFTLGFTFKINMAGLIGMALSVVAYRFSDRF